MFRLGHKALLFSPPDTIEPEALKQIENTASMPFIYKHVAVMPDCHFGKGATVGTVLATRHAIIPAAVGVDIGCGMIAVKTPLQRNDISDPSAIRVGNRAPDTDERRPQQQGSHRRAPRRASMSWRRSRSATTARSMPNGRSRSAPSAAATISSSLRPMKPAPSGRRCIPDRAASATRSANMHIRRAQALAKAQRVALPDRDLAYLLGRNSRLRRVHPRRSVGAEVRAAQSRRDDGPRDDGAEPACLRRREHTRRTWRCSASTAITISRSWRSISASACG